MGPCNADAEWLQTWIEGCRAPAAGIIFAMVQRVCCSVSAKPWVLPPIQVSGWHARPTAPGESCKLVSCLEASFGLWCVSFGIVIRFCAVSSPSSVVEKQLAPPARIMSSSGAGRARRLLVI